MQWFPLPDLYEASCITLGCQWCVIVSASWKPRSACTPCCRFSDSPAQKRSHPGDSHSLISSEVGAIKAMHEWLWIYLRCPTPAGFFASSLRFTINVTALTFLSLSPFQFLLAPIVFTVGAAMSSRCSSPAPSDSSQSPVVQVFPADFIHAQKLSKRLDRLLGADTYTCHWRLNQYFLDSWRHLNDVSGWALRV